MSTRAGSSDAAYRTPGARSRGGPSYRPRPAPALQDLQPYEVPRAPVPIDLRLDGNEGVLPSPQLLDALREAGPEVLRNYPDTKPLEAALAERHGVSPDSVIVTAGADEALDRLFRALTWPEREVVLPWPSFAMIPHYAKLAGATVREVGWTHGPYPTRSVLAKVNERTALVFCVSPNNPTGAVATRTEIASLCRGAGDALVVLDHAYAEFAEEELTTHALSQGNALVLRTFSKARGLAGLRVGYALGPPEVIRLMRAAGGPFAVSSASLVLAWSALRADDGRERAYIEQVSRERDSLKRLLDSLGAQALPSQGNFVLARFGDATWVRDALAGLGIGVRLFPQEPSLSECLRITCPGDASAYARLEHALASALTPRALLLDLDGVLVDGSAAQIRALPGLQAIAALRARLPLGVVTGLGRGEATRLLTVSGLLPLVSVLVTADDAPPKPDPRPVSLCLERIGARTAWMVGDNPSDATAARRAGAVPLGILSPYFAGKPDDVRQAHAAQLHEAGAARILEHLSDLGTLLDAAGRKAKPFAS